MATRATISTDLDYADRNGILQDAQDAASDQGVPLAFLLAVGSRESGLGRKLDPNCISAGGEHGIWQIHPRWHGTFTSQVSPCDHARNANYAAGLLRTEYRRFDNWRHAASAYNAGPDDVERTLREGHDPDIYTTGGNYGSDVAWRAQVVQELLDMPSYALPELIVEAEQPGFLERAGLPLFLGAGAVGSALWLYRQKQQSS